MQGERKRIVILGGGFAGVKTAQYLARHASALYDIVVVSSRHLQTFTPWLYEVAAGNADVQARAVKRALARSADIPLAALFANGNVRFRHTAVTGLDHDHRHVILDGGHTLGYDALVIALGTENAYFGIPGLKEFALPLKSTEHATAIHHRLGMLLQAIAAGERKGAQVVIAGAGPSGVELAAELSTMAQGLVRRGALPPNALRITLLDAAPRVLGMLHSKASRAVERRLRNLGVDVVLDTMIAEAQHDAITVRPRPHGEGENAISRSPFSTATRMASDMTVWTGGVKPNAVLEHFALAKDPRGRLRVTTSFESQNHPGIFALGDAALLLDPANSQPVPQTAQAAEHTAAFVARNVIRALEGRALVPYTFPKRWATVIAAGGAYGVASYGSFIVAGRLGYVLRRVVDLRYFVRTLPLLLALRTWYRGVALYRKNDN